MTPDQEHPLTNDLERECRLMIANLTRLTDWLTHHGVGSDVGIRSTVADHDADLLDLKDRVARLEAAQRG
jgi:hypothetical protein